MKGVPEDYYASEASDNGLDIEESQHLHFPGFSTGNDEQDDSSSKENSPPGVAIGEETQQALFDFREMFAHTPPWERAERAGMDPISPWRQTCDIPLSQRPPPSRRHAHVVGEPATRCAMEASPTPSPAVALSPGHHTRSDFTSFQAAALGPLSHSRLDSFGGNMPATPSPVSPSPHYYSRPNPRTPLSTLYERDCDDSEPAREMVDVACSTDPVDDALPLYVQHHSVGCQTEPQDEIIPEWLDKTVVEKELREGRDERLKEYVMRFRHSVAAASVDHRRAFMPSKRSSAPGALFQKMGHSTRPEFARVTKLKAREKIQSWYQDGAALDSQTDSQTWLNGALRADHAGPATSSLTATPADAHVVPTWITSGTLSSPSTPTRASSTAVASSPFSVWGMDPGIDASPSRFTENLARLTVVCGTARLSPRDLSFADLDALLEYQTKLNALLTEDLVVTHAKLHAMEDKFKAYSIYYGFSIDV